MLVKYLTKLVQGQLKLTLDQQPVVLVEQVVVRKNYGLGGPGNGRALGVSGSGGAAITSVATVVQEVVKVVAVATEVDFQVEVLVAVASVAADQEEDVAAAVVQT